MTLPREQLLEGSRDPAGLAPLIDQAETVLRTWQPSWSLFLEAPLQEEGLERLNGLSELSWHRDGGFPGAERCRLFCQRSSPDDESTQEAIRAPISGLLIEGNFLFDPLSPGDLRRALQDMGASADALGDLWVRGDRGGQGLVTPECASALHEHRGQIRDVEIRCEQVDLCQLQLPAQRNPKTLTTVEASCRIDAIASAGFGLSRSKVVSQIKAGRLRLNWQPVRQAGREINVGDRLQLQDRGSLEVLSCQRTKRERWRIELRRR